VLFNLVTLLLIGGLLLRGAGALTPAFQRG
jgi:hypothetical protein